MSLVVGCVVALAVSAQVSEPGASRSTRGTLVGTASVSFEAASADVTDAAALDAAAQLFRVIAPGKDLLIVGHVDGQGRRENRKRLSRRRARVVRDELVKRGVDPVALTFVGVGSTEPLSPAEPGKANPKNRRVEFWLVPQSPVATISWVHKDAWTSASTAAAASPAEVSAPLLRGHAVETKGDSATELAFNRARTLYVGSRSRLVVHDGPRERQATRRRAADVTLLAGEVTARIPRRGSRPLLLDTPAAQVRARTGRVRVRHDTLSNTLHVEVYEGAATVQANGRTLGLRKGQGVRVVGGRSADVPRNLAAAARWDMDDPTVVFAEEELGLYWKLPVRTSTVQVQIAIAGDDQFNRPIGTQTVVGAAAKIAQLPAGAYLVRLASVNRAGLVGPGGKALRLLVFEQPRALGVAVYSDQGALRMPGPGTLSIPSPPGTELLLGPKNAPAPPEGIALLIPGNYSVPYQLRLSDGRRFGAGLLDVRVAQANIVVSPLRPRLVGDRSETPVRFRVLGDGGQPISGLSFKQYKVDTPLPGLAKLIEEISGDRRAVFERCKCEAPANAPGIQDEGDGYYGFVYVRAAADHHREDLVRILDEDTKLVQEVSVPIGASTFRVSPPSRSGLTVGFRVGTQITDGGDPSFRTDVDFGGRLHLFGPLSLDLAAQVTYFRTDVRILDQSPSSTNAFPLQLRPGLHFDFDGFGGYVGGGAGVTLQVSSIVGAERGDIDRTTFFWSAIAGGFLSAGPGEAVFEIQFTSLSLSGPQDASRANIGPAFLVGYRFLAFGTGGEDEIEIGSNPGDDEDFLDVEDNFDY